VINSDEEVSSSTLPPGGLCGPLSLLSIGFRVPLSVGLKRQELKPDHSPPSGGNPDKAFSRVVSPL
jgi:hypothetical protein